MTVSLVPASKLPGLTTAELIEQYSLVEGNVGSRLVMPNLTMQHKRRCLIVDLLDARADAGDAEALRWFATADA